MGAGRESKENQSEVIQCKISVLQNLSQMFKKFMFCADFLNMKLRALIKNLVNLQIINTIYQDSKS